MVGGGGGVGPSTTNLGSCIDGMVGTGTLYTPLLSSFGFLI